MDDEPYRVSISELGAAGRVACRHYFYEVELDDLMNDKNTRKFWLETFGITLLPP